MLELGKGYRWLEFGELIMPGDLLWCRSEEGDKFWFPIQKVWDGQTIDQDHMPVKRLGIAGKTPEWIQAYLNLYYVDEIQNLESRCKALGERLVKADEESFRLRRKLYHANTLIEELQQGIAEITSNIEFHHAGATGRWMTTKEIDEWITKKLFQLEDAQEWAEIWKKAAKKWWRQKP